MTSEWIGAVVLLLMLGLMLVRVPVGLAMLIAGFGGFAWFSSLNGALAMLKQVPIDVLSNHDFSAIPLFILMGTLAARSGMAGQVFATTRVLCGGFRGGLLIAAVGACGAFAAISGSSLATASTMAGVSLPEMEKDGYHRGLAAGALAAGGTLGIMIPPSIALLLYAVMTEQSVGDMFIAGIMPGILGLLLYSLTIIIIVRLKPRWAQASRPSNLIAKARSLFGLLPFALLFVCIILGIYKGIFTPTEGAAVGAFATFIHACYKRKSSSELIQALFETLALSSVVFLMLIGAETLGYFISISRLSFSISEWIANLNTAPIMIILAILLMYIVLGMFMDAIAMLVITVPVVYPIILALGIDPVWFGIITVLTVELGLITPPVGLNIFVIKAAAPHIELGHIYKGVLPFIVADILRLGLLIAFPVLSLGLIAQNG